MSRAAILLGAFVAVLVSEPLAAAPATARAAAQASVVEPAAFRMNWAMAMPSVQGTRDGAAFAGNTPTMSMMTGVMVRNDSLTVRREEPEALTAPGGFTVMRTEGEAVILRTSAGGDFFIGDGLVVGGQLDGAAAASIEVAGGRWSPAGQAMVVVVQYN